MRRLHKFGTAIRYRQLFRKSRNELSVLTLADPSLADTYGQPSVIVRLLVGGLAQKTIFHCLSWISKKFKRPVKTVPAAEILASSEAIDEVKGIPHAVSKILLIDVRIHLCVEIEDLFTYLST